MKPPGCKAKPGDRVFVHTLPESAAEHDLSPFGTVVEDRPGNAGCLIKPDTGGGPFGWGYVEFNWVPVAGDRWLREREVVPASYPGGELDWLLDEEAPPAEVLRTEVVIMGIDVLPPRAAFIGPNGKLDAVDLGDFLKAARRLRVAARVSRYDALMDRDVHDLGGRT